MRNIYDPTPGNEIIPYTKLIIDYEINGDPIYRHKTEICKRIKNRIYYAGYDRLPAIYSLPDDPDDFIIPQPIYT